MLIDFTIKNFMSYRDEVSLNMCASTTVKECEGDGEKSNVSVIGNNKRILRTAAIYGANGSGKSTVIAALDIFKTMILRSFVDENIVKRLSSLYYHFDVMSANEPVSMQMIFICDERRYRYGFEVRQGKVLTEWLYVLPKDSKRESCCFTREGQSFRINSRNMKGTRGVASKTRSNALFLSTSAQFNVEVAMNVKEWLRKRFNILSGLDNTLAYTAREFMHNTLIREQILQMLCVVDTCIKNVNVKEDVREVSAQDSPFELLSRLGLNLSNETTKRIEQHELDIQATHNVYDNGAVVGDASLNFNFESFGTTKLFALLGPFFDTIHNGGVLVIDEFGNSLHTQLSAELLKLFYSEMNIAGAQLVIATHDTNLLRKDLLRRDQIWFAEKNSEGVSDLYSLVEYKINQANSVRNDASFSKDYLLGRYGAIPYFGNLHKFISDYGGKREKQV